ncbi:aryl-alcohol dehydrogenase [Moniliophthora roreri MCA 2997]|uniref:Aryl-alcohol dehydrogenase n=1 Tax=Moniliophthora roreri (strain MCA 2997) TaxID=1381753 RepID=V2X5E7_MONRO|nr:aryl-alcohol dehydrogenase [Moniliophthora roreri MCA 2997]
MLDFATFDDGKDGITDEEIDCDNLPEDISDTPAWAVANANQYARGHGKTPFVVYQGEWNVMQQFFEWEIIPMARHLGMAIAPFGVLAGGKLRTVAEEQRRLELGEEGRKTLGD